MGTGADEETAYPDAVVDLALAHIVGTETERAYRRGDKLRMRYRFMEDWAQYCDRPLEGEEGEGHGEVVPLRT
jgi:hypothetical protein